MKPFGFFNEKAMQRALIQYRNPKNYDLVHEALQVAGREDLIGFDKKCLIRPKKETYSGGNSSKRQDNKAKTVKPVKSKKTIRNIHKKKSK